ncbi:MAG TPA: hypothetical protein VGO85_00180 [Caldimonas sp.]|nr:hypothetical protein [Caldimonas sp.]
MVPGASLGNRRTARSFVRFGILRRRHPPECRGITQSAVVCRLVRCALRCVRTGCDLMNVVEKIFAAAMVVACVLLLARMVLKPRRRARVDASLRRNGELWQRRVRRFVAWPAAELRARRATKEAIRRARRSAIERDGNVLSPKAFKGKRRDLH